MTPTPLAIGQLRRDPDPRELPPRIVRIVKIGIPSVYTDTPGASAIVECVCGGNVGRRSRVRLDRLERWPVARTAWIVVDPDTRQPLGWPLWKLHGPCSEEEARAFVARHGSDLEVVHVALPDLSMGDTWLREIWSVERRP